MPETLKELLKVNINGIVNVLEAALKLGCQKVVNISSSEEYGKPVKMLKKEGIQNVDLPIELCGKNLKSVFEPEGEFEIRHRFAEIFKMRTILGYKPGFDVKKGVKLTVERHKQILEGV